MEDLALEHYISSIGNLAARLQPAQTLRLMRDIGRKLRQQNKRRIQANVGPDGAPFTPAKGLAQGRKIRRLRTEQDFMLGGRLHRYRTLHDYGGYYIGWDYRTRTTIKADKAKLHLPAGEGKRRQMFRKIHQYKYLKIKTQPHEAAVGFLGGLTGYIAAAHQHGEDNRPERHLLGFSADDYRLIEQMLRRHFSGDDA